MALPVSARPVTDAGCSRPCSDLRGRLPRLLSPPRTEALPVTGAFASSRSLVPGGRCLTLELRVAGDPSVCDLESPQELLLPVRCGLTAHAHPSPLSPHPWEPRPVVSMPTLRSSAPWPWSGPWAAGLHF